MRETVVCTGLDKYILCICHFNVFNTVLPNFQFLKPKW